MKNARTGVVVLAALLGGLAIWVFGVRSVASEAVYPVENGTLWFSRNVCARLRGFFSAAEIAVENGRLKREVAALSMVRQDAELAREESARLCAFLGFKPSTSGRWLPAPVLSNGGASSVVSIIRVGRGSLSGVSVGDVVAVPDGLVGRVTSVSPHTAEVTLITDPSLNVACEVVTHDSSVGGVRGIISGGGVRSATDNPLVLLYVVDPLRLRYLGRDFEPPPRARVETSGLGGVFPKGILVGFLLETRVDDANLAREGRVVPAVDFSALEGVFIRHEK